jgi:hypothetical protein
MRLPRRRFQLAIVLAAGLGLVGGCGRGVPSDTAPVLLAEGQAGAQPWRLEGRRQQGEPCATLVLVGLGRPPVERCGMRRTKLRHLEPVSVTVGGRLLVFAPVPARARRVRLDLADGAIRIEPARTATGFPARFFVVELQRPAETVRVFAEGGRAIVS